MEAQSSPSESPFASPFASQPVPPSFPKAGGALRSTNEKCNLHQPTGKCTLSIPLPITPGRNDFSPNLHLRYDSSRGNGPFGMGWNVNVMQISRRTSKGVPRYNDTDVFYFQTDNGCDDLVPLPYEEIQDITFEGYDVRQYETRLFTTPMRLFQLTSTRDKSEIHWQHRSGDNVLSLLGTGPESRITSPAGDIFCWLIKRNEDCYGNVIEYQYRPEDDTNVPVDSIRERNRARRSNRYLESVRYGNSPTCFHFEVFFNYSGVHASDAARSLQSGGNPNTDWAYRGDAFSSYRSSFEIRTYRLCHDVMFLHHFSGEKDSLVRSMNLIYGTDISQLNSLTITGHKHGAVKSLPTSHFSYNTPAPLEVEPRVMDLDLPPGVRSVRWIDVDGTGISSLVAECDEKVFVKRNMTTQDGELRLAAWEDFTPDVCLKNGQIIDFDGDGRLEYVNYKLGFSRRQECHWQDFQAFTQIPNIDASRTRFVDLTGSGSRDVMAVEVGRYSWYEWNDLGFKDPKMVRFDSDAARQDEKLYLADMSGDGLIDLVRIRNGSISYFPNTGYGLFGEMVEMENVPVFDYFDHRGVWLSDIDGSGANDLVYLTGDGKLDIYRNLSGNAWSHVGSLPAPASTTSLVIADLFGNGAMCAVCCDLDRGLLSYLPLTNSKPRLLESYDNGAGLATRFEYTSTARLYNQDGIKWRTTVPFPVHCVTRITSHDSVSRKITVRRFQYADGYYDHQDREFVGFGRVEEWDGPDEYCLCTRTFHFNGSLEQLSDGNFTDAVTFSALSGENQHQGLRALAGQISEQSTLDAELKKRFTSHKNRYDVSIRHRGSFLITRRWRQESVFELEDVARVSEHSILEVDKYGNVLSSLDVYNGNPSATLAQRRTEAILTENAVTDVCDNSLCFRAPVIYESRRYQVNVLPKILLTSTRTIFRSDDLSEDLDKGKIGNLALVAYTAHLAFIKPEKFTAYDLSNAGYTDLDDDGNWWSTSTRWKADFKTDFFLARYASDAFGNSYTIDYDDYCLAVVKITDPEGNVSTAKYDYHSLKPLIVTEPSGISKTFEYDELGNLIREGRSSNEFQLTNLPEKESCEVRKMIGNSIKYTMLDFSIPCRQVTASRLNADDLSVQVDYLDGSGQICQTRRSVDIGVWLVSSWAAFDTQGSKQIECQPYYDTTSEFSIPENPVRKTIMHDSLRRPILTVREDGAWSLTRYGAWSREVYDFGDTVGLELPPSLSQRLKQVGCEVLMSNDQVYAQTPKTFQLDCQGVDVMAEEKIDSNSTYKWSKDVFLNGQDITVYDSIGRPCIREISNALSEKYWSLSADKGEQLTLKSVDGFVSKDVRGAYTKTFTFDSLRRPVEDLENGNVTVSRTYHTDNQRLKTIMEESGVTTFNCYDVWGNATRYTRELQIHPACGTKTSTRVCFEVEKSFNFESQPLSMRLIEPSMSVSWSYDALGRQKSSGGIIDVTYDAKGRVLSFQHKNGCTTTNAYDKLWLKSKITENHERPVQSISYDRDITGRIIAIADTTYFMGKGTPLMSSFSYDALGRLKKASTWEYPTSRAHWNLPMPHECIENFEYDTESNLLTLKRGDNIRQYFYAAKSHRLLSVQPGSEQPQQLLYDGPDGSLGLPTSMDGTKWEWTSSQRLQHIHDAARCSVYQYDSAGTRCSKMVKSALGERMLAFIEGFEICLSGQTLQVQASVRVGQELVGYLHYDPKVGLQITHVVTDHLGSVSLELDTVGSVLSYTTYRPYGMPITLSLVQRQECSKSKFTGKPYEEAQLTFCDHRYLSHEFCRWISPDPIGLEGGSTNFYCYANADPINLLDRDGLCPRANDEPQMQQKVSPIKIIGYVGSAYLQYRLFSGVGNVMDLAWQSKMSRSPLAKIPHLKGVQMLTAALSVGVANHILLTKMEKSEGRRTGIPRYDEYNDSASTGSHFSDIATVVTALRTGIWTPSTFALAGQIIKEGFAGSQSTMRKSETETVINSFTGSRRVHEINYFTDGNLTKLHHVSTTEPNN